MHFLLIDDDAALLLQTVAQRSDEDFLRLGTLALQQGCLDLVLDDVELGVGRLRFFKQSNDCALLCRD